MSLSTAEFRAKLRRIVPAGDDRVRKNFAEIVGAFEALADAAAALLPGTATQVVFYDSNGRPVGEAAFAYDASNDILTVKNITLADAGNVAVNTTTGTKIGTAVGQKLGMWGATPVIQPASADQATVAALTENTGAIGGSNDGDLPDLSAADATLGAAIRECAAKINQQNTLLLAIRTALVNIGIIKGSA